MTGSQLICLTGIDGAGKSTLARNVRDELENRGYDATYVYGRYLPRLAYPIMELGRRTVFSDTSMEDDYVKHQEEKAGLFERRWVRRSYELLLMADYAPQLCYRLLHPLLTADYVICDRFFYDTLLTDLSGDVIRSPEEAVRRYRWYARILPTPDYEFYIEIPPEVSIERKDDVPMIEYLEDRKSFYDYFATELKMKCLDGTMSQESLSAAVVEEIT